MKRYLGIDCGSVSLNLALLTEGTDEPVTVYRRTRGRPLLEFIAAIDELIAMTGTDVPVESALVTGSGRELLSKALNLPAVNEITAHAAGAYRTNPGIRTIVEVGGQDSKFMTVTPSSFSDLPRIPVFRMNEICAAGTGAFLDEQAERLGIDVDTFGSLACRSRSPAAIAGRCSVFAKTDMIHHAQEGTPIPDILLGLAFALVRNYVATLIRGEALEPIVSLQGGVMSNSAVVYAFRKLLGLNDDQIVILPHFKVMGAIGCAILAGRNETAGGLTLGTLRAVACDSSKARISLSFSQPLDQSQDWGIRSVVRNGDEASFEGPFVMGLDVGSVSVKGVIIDSAGHIVRQDYRLSMSRTLETVHAVLESLGTDPLTPQAVAVTGSGRHLVGRLLDADLIIDEITAQVAAALSFSPQVDTIVEIGGQDAKWIRLEDGHVKDFEMNRVCAAGTGSFLMAQARRLGLSMGPQFSESAFAARRPSDLGTRCTVFMESDLVHHQNNGASCDDLAAGVCISIVRNYLDRVANNKPIGSHVLFLGGVAATSAVRAAFEQCTGRRFAIPEFFMVSGAVGAALKASEKLKRGEIQSKRPTQIALRQSHIRRDHFTCKGCTNRCRVSRYRSPERVVFQGGLCDRWEVEDHSKAHGREQDLFSVRARMLDRLAASPPHGGESRWGMVRSPQFYEWFPFWHGFTQVLGIPLVVAEQANREQFEGGSRFLRVETCLPMKTLAGQVANLVDSGIGTIFHPSILNERTVGDDEKLVEHCPYIQASSLFFKGAFDLEWKEPVISFAVDDDSFRREHVRFAVELGFSRRRAWQAFQAGFLSLARHDARLREEGASFLDSLGDEEKALVVLGKPYHTADAFLNMNLGSIFQRLGVRAMPSDLFPVDDRVPWPSIYWKYQGNMIRVAREISRDPRLFPVMITFFGCGPDPFTLRHITDALGDKPLLVLEMDEHSSRAGIITRIEAFLEQVRHRSPQKRRETDCASTETSHQCRDHIPRVSELATGQAADCVPRIEDASTEAPGSFSLNRVVRAPVAKILYLPYMCEHSYGFAAAARSVGIDARVLPPPDQESENLGRPHTVSGECHPYALILGDYLKLSQKASDHSAPRSLFYILGPEACRLGQFPIYIDKIRRELGLSIGVIWEVDQGLAAFGLSEKNRRRVYLRAWEGLNAYDVLLRVFLELRPHARDKALLESAYTACRDKLFVAISENRVRHGMEEVLHELHRVPMEQNEPRPAVSVTGDYYTRVVPFANNDVYREIEDLGGTIWSPPTFSDSLKMGTLRDLMWNVLNGRSSEAWRKGLLYMLLAVSELRVKGSPMMRRTLREPLDLLGRTMWKTASKHAQTRLPAGITAPIATALHHLDQGADGVLNLITLNCSYGTVVTAALSRALKQQDGIPMLTLIYDGLKKTNERTRLEAFMEQAWDHFKWSPERGRSRRRVFLGEWEHKHKRLSV